MVGKTEKGSEKKKLDSSNHHTPRKEVVRLKKGGRTRTKQARVSNKNNTNVLRKALDTLQCRWKTPGTLSWERESTGTLRKSEAHIGLKNVIKPPKGMKGSVAGERVNGPTGNRAARFRISVGERKGVPLKARRKHGRDKMPVFSGE